MLKHHYNFTLRLVLADMLQKGFITYSKVQKWCASFYASPTTGASRAIRCCDRKKTQETNVAAAKAKHTKHFVLI